MQQSPDGLVTKKSALSPEETMKRLVAESRGKGLTVFARAPGPHGHQAIRPESGDLARSGGLTEE